MDQARDRACGALLGIAVGDALGTTLEFVSRDTAPRHAEIIGAGPFRLPAGVWTDDTSMALALAESLAEQGALDPADVARRWIAWWREGVYSPTGRCFDIGTITRDALARIRTSGDPFGGLAAENMAGNGSLMRLSPVVLPAFAAPDLAAQMARTQSLITHGAPQAVDACAWFARLLCTTIASGTRPQPTPDARLHPSVAAVVAGPWDKPREEIISSGYVVHTLEAALWAVSTTSSFEEALVEAVNLGDDADTVGAVAGQLAGALYGAAAIPQRWLARLAWRERLQAAATTLAAQRW